MKNNTLLYFQTDVMEEDVAINARAVLVQCPSFGCAHHLVEEAVAEAAEARAAMEAITAAAENKFIKSFNVPIKIKSILEE